MKLREKFPDEIIAVIHRDRILGIRAGSDSEYRIIGLWAVIVEKRVFVRSWSLKPRSWWRIFLEDPYGIIVVGEREIHVRAIQTRSERLKDLVSGAYKKKYNKPGDIPYVKDMSRKNSRDTTTELVMKTGKNGNE